MSITTCHCDSSLKRYSRSQTRVACKRFFASPRFSFISGKQSERTISTVGWNSPLSTLSPNQPNRRPTRGGGGVCAPSVRRKASRLSLGEIVRWFWFCDGAFLLAATLFTRKWSFDSSCLTFHLSRKHEPK